MCVRLILFRGSLQIIQGSGFFLLYWPNEFALKVHPSLVFLQLQKRVCEAPNPIACVILKALFSSLHALCGSTGGGGVAVGHQQWRMSQLSLKSMSMNRGRNIQPNKWVIFQNDANWRKIKIKKLWPKRKKKKWEEDGKQEKKDDKISVWRSCYCHAAHIIYKISKIEILLCENYCGIFQLGDACLACCRVSRSLCGALLCVWGGAEQR